MQISAFLECNKAQLMCSGCYKEVLNRDDWLPEI